MAEPDERVGEVDWPRLLARVLPFTDIFLPSLGELRTMLRPAGARPATPETDQSVDESEVRQLAEECLTLGCKVAGVKLGRFGLYLRTSDHDRMTELATRLSGLDAGAWSNRELWSPIFEVEVAGTTGSGDTSIAGFLAALLDRRDPAACLDFACAVGSLCVEADDAVSGIASRAAAEARARSALPRPAPPLPSTWGRLFAGSAILAGPRDRRSPPVKAPG
jgi:sugar/nucleoside kinase (ribokinase family)